VTNEGVEKAKAVTKEYPSLKEATLLRGYS